MLIKKTTPVAAPVFKNQFEINTEWMFGDADGDGEVILRVDDANERFLPEFFKFLERLEYAHSDGKGGYDGYEWVPGATYFSDWEFCDGPEEEEVETGGICLSYPHGGSDGEIPSFEGYTIFHYDNDGVKRNVEVVFSPEEADELRKETNAAEKKYA